MKKIHLLLLIALFLSSCASQKRAWYLQDAENNTVSNITTDYQIKIKPLDRLTVIVNSKNPELAAPFNTSSSLNSLTGVTGGQTTTSSITAIQTRSIDDNGILNMPIIGDIQCTGLTRSELERKIAKLIIDGEYINDPTVNINFVDMKISVIGEVRTPGQYDIASDRISLFDALAMAGDLTIYGKRDDVAITREENGERTVVYLNLNSKEIFESPYYYLQQNDIVYIKPNKAKSAAGEIDQNRTFYLSLASTAISVATLIVTLTR